MEVFFLYSGWLIINFLTIHFSRIFVPYLGFFPYKEVADGYHLIPQLTALANFDGDHYLVIAREGYHTYDQAFFPLYPLLIKYFSVIFHNNLLIAALIISHLCFLLALYIFKNYLKLLGKNSREIFWIMIFILVFPASFFFQAVYTESLFFLLFIITLFFIKKENYLLAAIFAFLTCLTKLMGIFLIIPIFLHFISFIYEKQHKLSISSLFNTNFLLLFFAPFIGLGTYCFYLWKTTGDPLFFFNSQPAFGAHRSTHVILLPQVLFRYIKIFFHSQHNFQYYISLLEFFIFLFVLLILSLDIANLVNQKKDKRYFDNYSLTFFSYVNLLLPTLTGTLSSIPRYALFSLSFFLLLGSIRHTILKIAIITFFFFLHIIMLGAFVQGYFVS